MALILDVLSHLLLMAGAFFGISGAVGLLRFPDFYTRIHAASVTDSMATCLIMSGLILQSDFGLVTAKLVFILFFLLVTGPTASHALAKAARHGGLLAMSESHVDNKQASPLPEKGTG